MKDIKSNEDILRYIEGCTNDLLTGVSTKEETNNLILELVLHVAELARKPKVDQEISKLREEVEQWVKQNPNSGLLGNIPTRSCWNCNEGHKHLKNVNYPIECYDCGEIYYKGIKLTNGDGWNCD